MKIRTGFVSNSSTSSFICALCGEIEAGMDMSISDTGMFECKHGHYVCISHLEGIAKEKFEKREEDEENEAHYAVSVDICPICSLTSIPDKILFNYLLKDFNLDKNKILADIRIQFKTLEEVHNFILGKFSPKPLIDRKDIGTRLLRCTKE